VRYMQMKVLEFKPPALRQWLKLTKVTRDRIDSRLMEFMKSGTGDVTRLRGRSGSRLRVGDWRVLFEDDGQTITVYAVGHRRDIYE